MDALPGQHSALPLWKNLNKPDLTGIQHLSFYSTVSLQNSWENPPEGVRKLEKERLDIST